MRLEGQGQGKEYNTDAYCAKMPTRLMKQKMRKWSCYNPTVNRHEGRHGRRTNHVELPKKRCSYFHNVTEPATRFEQKGANHLMVHQAVGCAG